MWVWTDVSVSSPDAGICHVWCLQNPTIMFSYLEWWSRGIPQSVSKQNAGSTCSGFNVVSWRWAHSLSLGDHWQQISSPFLFNVCCLCGLFWTTRAVDMALSSFEEGPLRVPHGACNGPSQNSAAIEIYACCDCLCCVEVQNCHCHMCTCVCACVCVCERQIDRQTEEQYRDQACDPSLS